jgi:hypothetical protein
MTRRFLEMPRVVVAGGLAGFVAVVLLAAQAEGHAALLYRRN